MSPTTAAPLHFSSDAEDTIASKPVGLFAARSAAALYLCVRFGFRWFFVFPGEHLVTAAAGGRRWRRYGCLFQLLFQHAADDDDDDDDGTKFQTSPSGSPLEKPE